MEIAEKIKIGDKILGTWKLVSWVFEKENGEVVNYFGDNPNGLLTYMESGYMSVQVFKEGRLPFTSSSFDDGTLDEKASAFETYIAYYGKYKEVEPSVYVHEIESSLFTNWVGNIQMRYAVLDNNILTLSTETLPTTAGGIIFKLKWRKFL